MISKVIFRIWMNSREKKSLDLPIPIVAARKIKVGAANSRLSLLLGKKYLGVWVYHHEGSCGDNGSVIIQ